MDFIVVLNLPVNHKAFFFTKENDFFFKKKNICLLMCFFLLLFFTRNTISKYPISICVLPLFYPSLLTKNLVGKIQFFGILIGYLQHRVRQNIPSTLREYSFLEFEVKYGLLQVNFLSNNLLILMNFSTNFTQTKHTHEI